MNIKSKFKNNPLVFLAGLIFALTFTVTPVLANSGAGEGGGSQTGEATMWREINGEAGTSKAWNTFMSQRGIYNYPGGDAEIERIVTEAGGQAGSYDLLEMCKQSEYIWYYSYPNKLDWSPYGDGTNRVPWQGTLVDNPRRWARFTNTNFGTDVWNRGRTVIICSGAFDVSYKGSGSMSYDEDISPITVSGDKTKLTMKATMTPEQIKDQPKEWGNRNNTLKSPLVKTSLGEWLEKNPTPKANASYNTWKNYFDKLQSQANSNNAGQQSLKIEGIDSEEMQKQFKQGGVWTITEISERLTAKLERSQKVSGSVSWNAKGCSPLKGSANAEYYKAKRVVESSTASANQKKQAYETIRSLLSSLNCDSKSVPSKWSTKYVGDPFIKKGTTPYVKRLNDQPEYYQLLSVRCNKTGFGQVSSYGGKILTGDNDVLGMIQSPRYYKAGDKYYGNGGKAGQTGNGSFFTKTENCEGLVSCVPTPNKDFAGSEQNVINKPVVPKDMETGKDIPDWVNDDTITFFRDGEAHDVRLNLWYPEATAIGKKANVTIKNSPKDIDLYVSVNETYKDSQYFMLNNKYLSDYQKNGQSFTGEKPLNIAEFKGQWATDDGKPIEANFAWEYKINSKVKLPGIIDNNNVNMTDGSIDFKAACDLGKPGTTSSKPWFDETNTNKNREKIKFSKDRQRAIVEFVRSINADN